ncbi:DsbA family protein [Actinopolymorpha pittospori]|uniref:Protein-disulfide isomerase n=1 Tax=Actinopolymorpha pittospori TaxID=648752 RepID=A0A927MQY8_9ACTN|nr:thioredoxin domain-containing protein [Actinopolymorpha pittospori]MBE1604612.1 protein-disulfide isomerase [Actinopolymorpha pittospori]
MTIPTPRFPVPEHVPANSSTEKDGIVVGVGPVTVDAYIDFLCPFCRQFEATSGPTLERLVDEELISLVHHPMGFLDELSTNHYSSRASAASGCASDQGRFLEFAAALFAHQPPEVGPGHTDEELVALGALAGVTDPPFAACVLTGTYLDWTTYVTRMAVGRGVGATPTVTVQGVPVPANPRTIVTAVDQASNAPTRPEHETRPENQWRTHWL